MINKKYFNKKNWNEKFPNHKVDLSKLYIHSSWKNIINNEFKKEYFKKNK
jgi:hypothetical protein